MVTDLLAVAHGNKNLDLVGISLFQPRSSIVSIVFTRQGHHAFGVPPFRDPSEAQQIDMTSVPYVALYGTHLRDEPILLNRKYRDCIINLRWKKEMMTVKSHERIESAIHDLRRKTEEYEEAGRRLLDLSGELECAAMGVFERARSTTSLIAGEFREDFGRKPASGEDLWQKKNYSAEESELEEFDRWLAAHKDEVRRIVCDNLSYEEAAFCQTH
jgi:hypothetical protein